MGIFDSIKDIWGDVKGLGGEIRGLGGDISSGFSGIRRSVSGIERSVTSRISGVERTVGKDFSGIEHSVSRIGSTVGKDFSGIEHSVSRMGSTLGKEFKSGFQTVARGLDSEWRKVGSSITNEIEMVGSDTVNFVTDGVIGIDKGLGVVTAELTKYIPKMYMEIIPRVLRGIYQTISDLLPELLMIPGNVMVFLIAFFLTILGGSYLKGKVIDRLEKEVAGIQDLDPSILHPDLDLDEAENAIKSVLGSL